MMKKLFFTGMLMLGLGSAFAQDYPGALNLTVKEMYLVNNPVVIHTEYLRGEPASDMMDYRWEVQPVNDDGIAGEPIYAQEFSGDPSGDFRMPEEVMAAMAAESYYQVSLTGNDANGIALASGSYKFLYTNLTLEVDDEICCGTDIRAYLNVAFDVAANTTYQYTLTMCDANGNPLWPSPYYDSGIHFGFPYVLEFPGTSQLACDTYWRIDFNINGSQFDAMRFRRTKVIYVTSFKMKAKTVYCCGQSLSASAENCPGSVYNVTHHIWQALPCQADGSNPGAPIYLGSSFTTNGTTEVIPATQLACGQYYRLNCVFFSNNTALSNRYKVIYIAAIPQPVITGPSTICGTGNYCVNNLGAGYSYQWEACYGNLIQSVYNGGANCYTPPIGNFTHMNVIAKDVNGCPSPLTWYGPVTNNYIDPSFYVWWINSPVDPNHFSIGFQRGSQQGSSADVFKVEEVSSTAPYAPVAGTGWTNPCWGSTNLQQWYTPVYFWGYNGDANGYGNVTFPLCPPCSYQQGHFRKDRTYKVTRTINNGGCVSTMEIVFNKDGLVTSTHYREHGHTMEEQPAMADAFTVFPNPNNGSFQVQLSAPAENAQAELVNLLGETVDAFQFSGTNYSYVPSTTLAPGIYLLRVTNNGTMSSQRIMIE